MATRYTHCKKIQSVAIELIRCRSRGRFASPNFNLWFQCPVYRTLVGNLQESLALLGAQCAFQSDIAIDAIDLAFLGFAIKAILCVYLVVSEPHRGPFKRQLFVVGVKPQRHRCAGAESSEQQIVRARTGIEPSRFDGLVGKKAMLPA